MPASVRDVLLLIRTKEDAQRALAGISREMRRAQAVADAANARANAHAARAHAEQLRLTGATRSQVSAVMAQAKAFDQQASAVERSRKRQELLTRAVTHGGEALTAMGGAAVIGGAGLVYGLKRAIDTAVEYDRQVRLTWTQVDKRFKPSLIELGEIGRRVARDIAVPFEQIQPALFEVFGSTEAGLKDAERLLRAFSKAAVAGQTDIQTASKATIGLMNAYSLPFKDVNRVLDIQFQLVQEGVGTYEEWAQRIGLVTPSAVRAGQSIETMAAALATSTRLGISAARSGTAVARAFDAISNPKTVANLEKLGVKMRDAKGNMVPLVDILTQWRKQLEKLPKKDRIESLLDTIKGAGSTIEARRFLQNMLLTKGGLELFQDILGEMEGDVGAFDRAYAQMADSTAAKSERVRNQWQLLKEAIGRALIPAFEDLLDWMQKLLEKFDRLPASTKKTIANFLLIAGILGIVGGAIALVLGGIGMFAIALAGITAGGWAVIGAITGIGAALLTLGILVWQAYEKSEAFREVIHSIKDLAIAAKDALVGFAQDVAAKFRENLLPALRELWSTIEEKILPKVKEFVDYARENLVPKLQEAGRIIKDILGKAFEYVGWIITEMIIPNLERLAEKWEENKDTILPLLTMLGQLAKILLIVAAVIAGVLIVALFGAAAAAQFLAVTVMGAVMRAMTWFKEAISTVIGWIKSFWEWLKKVDEKIRTFGNSTTAAMSKARNAMMNAFNGLPGKFAAIGTNIINSFIGGIRGKIQDAANAGAAIGNAAWVAAKNALGVKSPSKKFRDIGYATVQGMVKGINGSRQQLKDAMNRLLRDVMNSLKDGKASKSYQKTWERKIKGVTSKLLTLETKRAKVATKLEAAQKRLTDLQRARADLSEKVRDNLSRAGDLSTINARSPQQTVNVMRKRLDALKQFQQDLNILRSRGLNAESIADLAQAGVEGGGAMARALASSTGNEIAEINSMQKQIKAISAQVGEQTASQMYDAGIKAAQGLVKGLESQMKKITKQMEKIADALIKAIKKKLGIRSPSKVFEDIGIFTAQGWLNGYGNSMKKARNLHAEMFHFTPQVDPPPRGRVGVGNHPGDGLMPVNQRTFNQTINVYTNEIDPRKNAQELGWELEGRLR